MHGKVAFVSTTFDQLPEEYQGSHAAEEPLDVMYAAAAVRDAQARIVHFDAPGTAYLAEADVVVVSTTNSYLQWNNHPMGLDLFESVWARVRAAARADAHMIVFGPHVPANHQRLYELGADYVLLGEAELSAAALADALARGADPSPVAGLVERGGAPAKPAVVLDLDELPCPAYDQTVAVPYNAHNHPADGGHGHLYECSRGCPYFCNFCNTVTHRRAHRVKSVEKIRADLGRLAELTGRDYVYFIDESFGFRRQWFEDLMPVLTELPFSYGCQGNLSFASPEKLDAMRAAGFINVEFGYETANEDVIKRVGKNNRAGQSQEIINHAARIGLAPLLFTQVGLPGETPQTLKESLAFLRGLDQRTRVSIAMPTPYRGTQLWQEGVDSGAIPAAALGAELYRYTGRVGHDLPFDRDRARRFADDFGPNHHLTAEFIDRLEHDLQELFSL